LIGNTVYIGDETIRIIIEPCSMRVLWVHGNALGLEAAQQVEKGIVVHMPFRVC